MLLDLLAFFSLLFCLLLSSLAWFHCSLSSKYSEPVSLLLCAHRSMFSHKQHKHTQRARTRTSYFHSLLQMRVHAYLLLRSLCDTLGLYLSIFAEFKLRCRRTTTQKQTHIRSKGGDNYGEGAQYGPGLRPERLISILVRVNSLNLLPSPSRRQGTLPWPI